MKSVTDLCLWRGQLHQHQTCYWYLLMLMVCTFTIPFRTIILDGMQCVQLTRPESAKRWTLLILLGCKPYDKTWKTVSKSWIIMRTSSLIQFWKGVCDGIQDSKALVDYVWPHQRRGAAITLLDFNQRVNGERVRSWTSWELQPQWRSPEGTNGRAKVFIIQILHELLEGWWYR